MDGTDLELILNEEDSTLPLDLYQLAIKIGETTGRKTKITKTVKNIDGIGGVIIQATSKSPDLKLIMDKILEKINYLEGQKDNAKKYMMENAEAKKDYESYTKEIEDLQGKIQNNNGMINFTTNGEGKIVLDNTFEGILKQNESEICLRIARKLYQ